MFVSLPVRDRAPQDDSRMGGTAMQQSRLRISLVEDDPELRAHLAQLMSTVPDFELAGDFAHPKDAVEGIPKIAPDVVLMDINLPDLSGIECTRLIKRQLASVQILMLTVYEDSDLIFQSLAAGASGYLLKRTPGAKLIEGIRDLRQGGAPMSSEIARKVVQFFSERSASMEVLDRLSGREGEVLEALSRGRLYKEIAVELGVTLDTVRKHLQSIYRKLHVHSRTEAVVKFLGR